MSILSVGVIGRSSMEHERRVPIHPGHLPMVPERLRSAVRFERGYGEPFGVGDDELAASFGGVADRAELLDASDVVLLPKPLPEDLEQIGEGHVLWGWPHCVQQQQITQVAVERRLTLIAWEAMFIWKSGHRDMHLFYRNNEMAGYCGVAHAMELVGVDGFYGPPLKAVVLGFGSVSRGSLHALRMRGVEDVTVYTQRPPWAVHDRMAGARYAQMLRGGDGSSPVRTIEEDGRERAMVEALAEADIIVNGTLQDTDRPLMFLRAGEERRLRRGTLIVDVSCDEGMGFPFARPTGFTAPTFRAGPAVYYAVNHTPTFMWRSATWEISEVVVPYLDVVLGGPEAWDGDETIGRAIEIREGVIQNPKILSFQNRAEAYPHAVS